MVAGAVLGLGYRWLEQVCKGLWEMPWNAAVGDGNFGEVLGCAAI